LFEPAVFENGLPNPRHLSNEECLALARAAAMRGARRNGLPASRVKVDFPAGGFAPTRIEVSTRGEARLRLGDRQARERIPVQASATAEIAPDLNVAHGSGGGYEGPLAYRMGKPNPQLFSALESGSGGSAAPFAREATAIPRRSGHGTVRLPRSWRSNPLGGAPWVPRPGDCFAPVSGSRVSVSRHDRCSSVASASSRPVETPAFQRSSRASARVACRPLLRFVQSGSQGTFVSGLAGEEVLGIGGAGELLAQ
jgi:hypothetical protein